MLREGSWRRQNGGLEGGWRGIVVGYGIWFRVFPCVLMFLVSFFSNYCSFWRVLQVMSFLPFLLSVPLLLRICAPCFSFESCLHVTFYFCFPFQQETAWSDGHFGYQCQGILGSLAARDVCCFSFSFSFSLLTRICNDMMDCGFWRAGNLGRHDHLKLGSLGVAS